MRSSVHLHSMIHLLDCNVAKRQGPYVFMENEQASRTVGVILAGGRSRRMGASKPEQVLAGRSLLEHVVRRAEHQVDELILSSNSSSTFYQQFGLPIVPDRDDSQTGPLMGLASTMDWIIGQQTKNTALPLIACFPVDVPIFPNTIVVQLKRALLAQKSRSQSPLTPISYSHSSRCGTALQLKSSIRRSVRASMARSPCYRNLTQ